MSEHDSTVPVEAQAHRSGRHRVNIVHLVMGVAFVGLAVIWALLESGAASTSDLRWLLPVPWVTAGAVGLVASMTDVRRR